jgi:3-phosphoglycerate kinase
MAKYLTLDDVKVKDKVVLVRVDFNSEIEPTTKKVTSDVRIRLRRKALRLLFSRIREGKVTRTIRL